MVGVAIEFLALLIFGKEMSRIEKLMLIIGSLLVVGGVGGEYVFGGRAAHIATELQQQSDQAVAGLKAEQEADHKIATEAAAHAADLGVTIDGLRNFVAQKEKEADQQFSDFKKFADDEKTQTEALITQLSTDKTDLENARNDAQAAAKQAETELSVMHAENTPRGMNSAQQDEFVLRVTTFAGLTANVFSFPSTTPDAGPLADLLITLLKKANWNVGFGSPMSGWAKSVLVCVGDHPTSNVTDAAKAIALALRQDGITSFVDSKLGPNIALTGMGAPLPNPDMTIIVGAKQ